MQPNGKTMTAAGVRIAKARRRGESQDPRFAFQCKIRKLPEPREQYRFATSVGRQWRADFAFEEYKLIVEIDGGVWRKGGGAHSHPTDILRNMEKQNDAVLLGWYVLRFTTDQVLNKEAIAFTQRVLAARGWTGPA